MTWFVSQSSKSTKRLKLAETCLYACIGVASIGQIYFGATPLSYAQAVLALTGILFVALAIQVVTPITDMLLARRKRADSSVISLKIKEKGKGKGNLMPDDNNRHAA